MRITSVRFGVLLLSAAFALAPLPVLAGDRSTDISDALRFRSTFGLRADLPYVEMIEGDASASRQYGVALAPAELNELARREDLASRLGTVATYLATQDESFGGLYIDQPSGGRVVVELVGATESDRLAILDRMPTEAVVEFRAVRHTMRELEALYDRINKELPALEARGLVIHTVAISVPRNRIDIGLDRLDSTWVAELQARYDPLAIEFHAAEPLKAGTCTISNCPSPERLRAGLSLTANGYVCTAGFVVHNGSNSQLLTAGHCFLGAGVGTTVYHAGQSIGQISDTLYYDYSEADVKIINIPDSRESNWVFNQFSVTTPDLSIVGTPVCRQGLSSGVDCGVIVENTATVTYNGLHFINQGKTDFGSAGGDSGGPIYNTGGKAYGIFGSYTSTNSWYGRLEFFETDLNNYVCIDLSCVY